MATIKEWVWWTEEGSILLGYYDETKTEAEQFVSPDSTVAGQSLTLFYNKKADHFSIPSEDPDWETRICVIPEQFHDALVNKAIALGYERNPEAIQMAQYFNVKFESDVKNGRKYAYRGRLGTFRTINSVDF
tara:strand:+ start:390 stop:785 length:396 start_codon:yes stop_codon:yes gene_type:complete